MGEQLLEFFRRAVQLPLQSVDAPKLGIDAPGAKGHLWLPGNIFLSGLIRNAESVVSLSRMASK